MADIATPVVARKTEEFTSSQIELVRNSLAIADLPILPDRTYIVFDAVAGSNSLHIDTVGSTSYSINKGEGGLPTSYNDTGGTKILTYINAGRYLITITGTFNGIQVSGVQSDKDKYISIVGGSNYPTTIVLNAFSTCHELLSAIFPVVTDTSANSFLNCIKLKDVYFPLLVNTGQSCFSGNTSLEIASLPLALFAFGEVFSNCTKLKDVYLPSVTIIANVFDGCSALEKVHMPSLINIGSFGFRNCVNLKVFEFGPTVTISSSDSFLNVVLTDLYVNGTEAQAIVIQDDIVAAGGGFSVEARLIFGVNSEAGLKTNVLVNKFIGLGVPSTLTISAGAITITKSYHQIAGEGGSPDNLDTINGGVDGYLLMLKLSGASAVTVDKTGNILVDDTTRVLGAGRTKLFLMFDAGSSKWNEISFSVNTP